MKGRRNKPSDRIIRVPGGSKGTDKEYVMELTRLHIVLGRTRGIKTYCK